MMVTNQFETFHGLNDQLELGPQDWHKESDCALILIPIVANKEHIVLAFLEGLHFGLLALRHCKDGALVFMRLVVGSGEYRDAAGILILALPRVQLETVLELLVGSHKRL